jgi:hypothetical protein
MLLKNLQSYIKKVNKANKKVTFFTAFTFYAFFTLSTSFASQIHPNAGKTSATFLKIGLGARPVAMGESFAGISDDINAVYWNPSGLIQLDKNEITATHTEWFSDIRYEFAGMSIRFDKDNVGAVSIGGLYMSDLERRTYLEKPEDEPTLPEGTFGSKDIFAMLSYAHRIGKDISVGGNLKFIYEGIDIYSGFSFALDLSCLYKLNDRLTFGGIFQNIGPHLKLREVYYWLPINLKLGIGFKIPEYNLILGFDINQPIDNYIKLSVGAEYNLNNLIFVRAGYRYKWFGNDLGDLSGLTLGLGIKLEPYRIDYAFVPFGDLGVTHRISLNVKFGESVETKVKEVNKVNKEDK